MKALIRTFEFFQICISCQFQKDHAKLNKEKKIFDWYHLFAYCFEEHAIFYSQLTNHFFYGHSQESTENL